MAKHCPNPWKEAYNTRREAGRTARRSKNKLFPYLCSCGKWHQSSRPSLPKKELKHAHPKD
jgi:hypothetical protein